MQNNLRILAISDVQGNLDAFEQLYNSEKGQIDIIIHTGNFGFWDKETINSDKDNSFLKQIVAFSEVLNKDVVNELNTLSTIGASGPSVGSVSGPSFAASSASSGSAGVTSADPAASTAATAAAGTPSSASAASTLSSTATATDLLKSKLLSNSNSISQLESYLSGSFKFPCPVYTIFGPLDDPNVIHKFQSGEYNIPNLHLIDHTKCYEIPSPLDDQPNIKLYGIGGTLKIHSLFDHGNLDQEYTELCGKVGDLWISMIQIATMYHNVMNFNETRKSNNTISIFVTHAPIMKTPLLEHLAILTNADFSISQGLHFRYPVMGNGMSFVDSMGGSAGYIDSYRSKFSRLRMILGELWLIVKDNMVELLEESIQENKEEFKKLIELGLSLFDKIPVSINDSTEKIIPLTLFDPPTSTGIGTGAAGAASSGSSSATTSEGGRRSFSGPGGSSTSGLTTDDDNKKVLKKINDMYFSAYYNLWHFNLCDLITTQPNSNEQSDYNIMIFDLDKSSNFKLDYCTSQGFNFNFKVDGGRSGKKRFAYEIEEDDDEVGASDGDSEDSALGAGLSGGPDPEAEAEMEDIQAGEERATAGDDGDEDSTKGKYRGSKYNPNYRSRPGRGRGRGRSRGRSRSNYRARGT